MGLIPTKLSLLIYKPSATKLTKQSRL